MIIDIHAHIFPKNIRENRQKYFISEPAFKLLYSSPKSKMVGAQQIVSVMDEEGVDKAVVFGFPWQTADTFKRHNDYIIDAVQRYPDRLIGFGCFDPLHSKAPREAQRCIENGMFGIGELAFYESGFEAETLDRLSPIMEICRANDLPVMIHTNEPIGHHYPGKTPNTLAQIYAMVKRFNKNKIVLAHWGGGIFFFCLLKKEVRSTLQNVYFDTAASPFLYDGAIYSIAIRLAGTEKILFGSDFPLIKPSRYMKELEQAGLSKQEITSISGLNAARLLKL